MMHRPNGIEVAVYHSYEQREFINGYMKQYGDTLIDLGRLLVRAVKIPGVPVPPG